MRQKLDRELGYSLIEALVAISIIGFTGTMTSRWVILAQKSSQQIEGQARGNEILAHAMKKIRKSMSIRDMAVNPAIGPNTLTLSVPVSSASSASYSLRIETRCRQLPTGGGYTFVDMTEVTGSCINSFQCGSNSVPYIVWLRNNSIVESQPDQSAFYAEMNKPFSTVGYGLCFSNAGGTLNITGVLVSLETVDNIRKAKVKLQNLSVPINKRNAVDLVPQ